MIFAIDFDGTIVEHALPNIDKATLKEFAIEALKTIQGRRHKIILLTYREGRLLNEAVWFMKDNGIVFDAINENLPEIQSEWGSNYRKVLADYYLDDHSFPPFSGWKTFIEHMSFCEPNF